MILLAALGSGCMRPLALQDEYFSPANGSIASARAEALQTIRHHRALQAVKHDCPRAARSAPPPPGPDSGPGPGPAAGTGTGVPFAPAALAELCASAAAQPRPVAAHGSTSNAYRRWAQDQVRELPDPSETAASAAGG